MRLLLLSLALLLAATASAQTNKSFSKAMKQLRSFARRDSVGAQASVNRWWEERRKKNQVPLLSPDSAVFLYRGAAASVWWAGDFNGWGSKPAPGKGVRIKNTDIWAAAFKFPSTARFDYKVILNGKEWILDPVNPLQQYSGVGGGMPNSEIRMPGWKKDATQAARTGIVKGTITTKQLVSKVLGYDLAYSVYAPANMDASGLSILYVTDGNEYSDARLGNLITILDNLIADKAIKPIRVVFVDAREPANLANNRRMTELSLNENYVKFLTEELIEAVEGNKLVDRADRGILGTSLGGLTSAFFALKRPDLFGLVAIQSPAFWYKPEIFTLAEQNSGTPKLRTFISVGTFNDGQPEASRMKGILEQKGHTCKYIETAEGHSWGQWSNLMDDMLVALFSEQ